MKLGCNHELTHGKYNWQPDCRPCDVAKSMIESGAEFQFFTDELGDYRIIEGRAATAEQRDALTKLIAIARGDGDPRLLRE